MILEDIIAMLSEAVEVPVKPFYTDKVEDCVVYNFHLESDNGVVSEYRLELRVIAKSLEKTLAVERKIRKLFLSADETNMLDRGISSIVLNGGGTLKDIENNTIQELLYLVLTIKSEVI